MKSKIKLSELSDQELNSINGGSELSDGVVRFFGYISRKLFDCGATKYWMANSAGIAYK